MELWKQLLALTLTPTLAVAAIAWLIRKLFESGLQRDLEHYKSELELKRFAELVNENETHPLKI